MHQQQKSKTFPYKVSSRSKNNTNYFYCTIKTAPSTSLNILIRDDLATFKSLNTLNLNPGKNMHQQLKSNTSTHEVSPRSENSRNCFYCTIKTAPSKSLNSLIRDDLATSTAKTLNLNPGK